jgi:hypothetical protein
MVTAVILLALCTLLAPFGAFFVFRLYLNRKQAEIEGRLEDLARVWLVPPAPDQPHKLAEAVNQVGLIIGSAAARSLLASVKQDASSVAQVANGISDGVEAQHNPLKALISGGKRGKGAALLRLAELIGPMISHPGGNRQPDNGASSVASRIKNQG